MNGRHSWNWIFAAALLGVAAVSPARATTLFGLLDTGELYASTNGGVAWSIHATLPVNDAGGLAAGSSTSDLFLATRSGSIYRSTDGGSVWSAVGAVTASDVAGFTLAPFGDVLVLTRSGTLYSSSNGGVSFTPLAALTGSNWVCLARGKLVGTLYALTETGEVVQSTNYGAAWTYRGALTVSNAVSIRSHGSDLFILTATGEVAKSTDAGLTWVTVGALTQSGMSALLDVSSTELLVAAETGEVASSSDGVSWSWVGAMNQLHVMALGSDVPTVTGIESEASPPRFAGRAPYPNPSAGAPGAIFSFTVVGADRIRIELYDARGRLAAARPYESVGAAGTYARRWQPKGLSSGVYTVRYVSSGGAVRSAKWVIVR